MRESVSNKRETQSLTMVANNLQRCLASICICIDFKGFFLDWCTFFDALLSILFKSGNVISFFLNLSLFFVCAHFIVYSVVFAAFISLSPLFFPSFRLPIYDRRGGDNEMYISKERERERDGGIVITITHDTCLFCRFVPLPSSCDPTLSHLDNKNIYVIRKQLYVYSLFSCGKCV